MTVFEQFSHFYGLFKLSDSDIDYDYDSNCKLKGYTVTYRTFDTEWSSIQIPDLTANYRNGIEIVLKIGIKSVNLNKPSHALSLSGMHSKMRSDEFQIRWDLRWHVLPMLGSVQPGRFHDRVHHRLLGGPLSLLRGFKQN